VLSARTKHLPGPHAWIGQHESERLTDHWERLGFASLSAMENFIADTPLGPLAEKVRFLVSGRAFAAWRKHPYGMPRDLQKRFLEVWKSARNPRLFPEGTRGFIRLARVFGTLPTAWVLRRLRNRPYRELATIDAAEFTRMRRAVPPPAN